MSGATSPRSLAATSSPIDFERDYDWRRAAAETEQALRDGCRGRLPGRARRRRLARVRRLRRASTGRVLRGRRHETRSTREAVARLPALLLLIRRRHGSRGGCRERMHLVLGDGRRESFLVADFDAYYRRIRAEFRAAADAGFPDTKPVPCGHCGLCAWKDRCEHSGTTRTASSSSLASPASRSSG